MVIAEVLEILEREGIIITSAAVSHRLKLIYNISKMNRSKKVILFPEYIGSEIIEYYRLKYKNKLTKSKNL